MMSHSHEYHDELRANPERLIAETIPNGVQMFDGKPIFEHRHCKCGSDLALVLDEEWFQEAA